MTKRRKSSTRRKTQASSGLVPIIITLAILAIGIFGVIKGLAYRGDQIRQAAIDSSIAAQDEEAKKKQAFIDSIAPYAQTLHAQYQVLPSITIAQAILESNWGTSRLAADYKNLFGVKGTDPANSQVLETQEYTNGSWQTVKARFRVYPSFDASLLDHAQLLAQGTSWNPNQYQHVLQAGNYQDAAQALQTDGYATDPAYAQKIINIVEKYRLTRYDR
ncbi:N-acetylmuramidase [Agrilactobacillus composti DSM 18527 = JCM 14202]|uniref:N-acetylmuramidase n=1 Tax=Agrilactobacillus composti DSM 18527 = JCM 14202 TaxID=1423734 RepID=X0PGY6_9LACO|nr:glycoside hydrolase family 73 protein [Agrilactobacillus composti]KRM36158.1 N-acetylmuramidase [Agrilactobacillus composti DSM 18527 = JCM 14202]GAF41334.1 N-acetylmuramoyl-L-alanine amidase [Agrilactobacillus composti DSM 18527 = JCM 14202]